MSLNQPLGNVESQAGALGALVTPVKHIKYFLMIFLGYALTVVFHLQAKSQQRRQVTQANVLRFFSTVVITNGTGSITSSVVTLRVLVSPAINFSASGFTGTLQSASFA